VYLSSTFISKEKGDKKSIVNSIYRSRAIQYMEYEFHNYCWWGQNFMFEINFGGFLKIGRVVVW
jgi:hypothetical protein